MTTRTTQDRAHAGGDIVGRDKYERHYHDASKSAIVIEQLLEKLHAEMEDNKEVRETIEELKRFYENRSSDGINGLKEKLKVSGRDHEYADALEAKEIFAKLLEEWSLYASAQEIFAQILAHAEYQFRYFVYPVVGKVGEVEINQIVHERIVEPTVNQCGSSVFAINHNTVMGMIYWLAEQCFVRWHK